MLSRSLLLLTSLAFLTCWLPCRLQAQESSPSSAAALLEEVRQAVGWSKLASYKQGLQYQGTGQANGLEGPFELLFEPSGSFRSHLDTRLGNVDGFDGRVAWRRGFGGDIRRLSMGDREETLFQHWVWTAQWLHPDNPLEIELGQQTPDEIELSLRFPNGSGLAKLFLDRESLLPRRLIRSPESNEIVESFEDYRSPLGFQLPHRLVRVTRGIRTEYVIEKAGTAPAFLRSPYEFRLTYPDDTHFDPEAEAKLEVRKTRTGHTLVHPRLEGRDLGWFIFDTGAGAMCIDPETANTLELPALGRITATGIGGAVQASFRSGKRFQLGPLEIQDPIYVELDLSMLDAVFGVDIAGIVGYDVFRRAAIELDLEENEILLRDPRRFELEQEHWTPLIVDQNHPHVRCRFEGEHEAYFAIDTGAVGTAIFHAPTVKQLELLNGREVREGTSGGVGGMQKEYLGELAWFELAGHRFEQPEVSFSVAEEGALTRAHSAGLIGSDFLKPFRIVFDYSGERIALLKRK